LSVFRNIIAGIEMPDLRAVARLEFAACRHPLT
jgi:hypothetical protein